MGKTRIKKLEELDFEIDHASPEEAFYLAKKRIALRELPESKKERKTRRKNVNMHKKEMRNYEKWKKFSDKIRKKFSSRIKLLNEKTKLITVIAWNERTHKDIHLNINDVSVSLSHRYFYLNDRNAYLAIDKSIYIEKINLNYLEKKIKEVVDSIK